MENLYKQKLYKKLIEKAKEFAASIAEHTGRKLGSLIQIKEEDAVEPISGWTAYPPLSALADAGDSNGVSDSSRIVIYKKMVVRFSW